MIKKIFLTVFAFLLFSVTSNAKSSSTAPSISMIGDAVSGWGTDVVMSSTDGVNFTLSNFTFVNGGAKFRQDSSWSNNWGSNAFPSGTGASNGNNIPVTAGTYNVSFNITTGAYSFTNVVNYDAISISGTAGPGSNSDVSMITGDGINYSLAQYTLTSGTLVFRKDNSATTTWGSANFPTGTATQGGSGIIVSPGTYDIKFNKTTGAYTFTFATIGIIGSGTAGGWNTDTLMSTTDGVNYTIDGAVLTVGELKFRKNQSWTVAWGGSGFPTGTATLTGGNIAVIAGIYSISFNTITGAYNFISGYPVVSLFQTGGTDINFFTTDGVNYFLNNYSISAGDYIFRQSGTNTNTWGASSFPSGNATLGGSSIPVLAGDYNIVFNKVTGVFSFNYLTIGVIGSATPSGWSADTNLTTEDGVIYKLSGLTLGLGELKFRQGNSWDVNWGSSSFPGGTSTNGGSNIVVSKASNFTVTFNKLTGAYYFYDEVNLDAPSTVNMCKGSVVSSLSGSVFAVPGSVVKWYTVASGGIASLTAPSPTTSTLGTKTHYVSQTIGSIEGPRATMIVNVVAVPTDVPGAITSNTTGTTAGTFAAATLAVGPFVGTATTVSYRVPEFLGTNSYHWTVPAGVRIVGQAVGARTVTQTGANANVLNVNYSGIAAGIGAVGAITVQAQNASGCNGTAKSVAITKALPVAPAAIVMHDLSRPNNAVTDLPVAVTTFARYMGTNTVLRLTATPSLTATSYQWELPAGVNQLSGGTTNVITVNFAGVTSGNTDNFTTAAGVSTNVLRIGVKSVNGVGTSITANTALLNPTTGSTARLLTLTAVRPAAPTLKMFDMLMSSTVAVTDISKYIGTNTPLTLVGTVAATSVASSFSWELPADGVNLVSGSLTSNSIVVNFEDVAAGTASVHIGLKAVNGIGSSVTTNAGLSSTAVLVKLVAGLPSAAGTVVGSLAICSNQASSITYTITAAAAKANVYIITAPAGTTITGGVMNTRAINAVAGATFTVNYPNGFTSTTTARRTISIQSVNGFGVSATNKVLTLTSNTCTITSRTTAKVAPVAQDFKVIAYPNPSTGVFNLAIESSKASATTIQVYDMQGRMIESKQVNTNAVEIGGNYTSGIYNVILENAGQAKTIRLIKK